MICKKSSIQIKTNGIRINISLATKKRLSKATLNSKSVETQAGG